MYKRIKWILVLFLCYVVTFSFISAQASNFNINRIRDPLESPSLTIETTFHDDWLKFELSFPKPVVSDALGYDAVTIQDLPRYGAPGEPVLPYRTIKALIPQSSDVEDINVIPGRMRLLQQRLVVEYGRTPTPVGSPPTTISKPNEKIYNSVEPFPTSLFSDVSEQHLRGYKILLLTLYPVQYIPKTGELFHFETLTVDIALRQGKEVSPMFRNLPQDRETVSQFVDNPEVLKTYTALPMNRPTSVDNSSSYEYVIITTEDLNASFQPLINSKIQKGLNATTVMVSDIKNDPDYFGNGIYGDGYGTQFNDTAAQIRNFVKDAYLNWGTEYVLLGGDVGKVKHRGTYGFVATLPYTVDYNMPCDMYFGTLDGNWDNDNDTIFGEGVYPEDSDSPENGTAGDEADLLAEVYIGRAPVNSANATINFVNKTLWYEQTTDHEYLKKALMIGEILDEETRGGNNKDNVMNKIPQYTATRLYQRDYTYSKGSVISNINSGTHILNHDGHTNTDIMMDLTREEIDTLITNTDYFFGYSVGCYAAAFDMDSPVEHFVRSPHGAFAFVSNSRYGWYSPGTMFGSGDRFDNSFFQVMNDTTQHMGKTLQLSKEAFAGPTLSGSMRWTYFELNLLGDPETEIVTDLLSPTAHFETNPVAERLTPAVLKGFVNLTGFAKKGTVNGATFSNYTIEFNDVGVWKTDGIVLANNGQSEVVDDVLGSWDTNILTPRTVDLRMIVRDSNGTVGIDRWRVRIEELPAIRVQPQLTEIQAGLTFTVSVEMTDQENLEGLDFTLSWNSTLLEYVSHEIYMPVESYWWGVMHSPVDIDDEVNQTAGTYSINASSWIGFNGDGVAFNMTFQAKAVGTSNLGVHSSYLVKQMGQPIIHKIINGTVDITPGVHDIAIISVYHGTSVGEGYTANIQVEIANQGTWEETFNITCYANGSLTDKILISLNAFNTTTTTLRWNTTGWVKGNYSMSSTITVVEGETDTTDNSMIGGFVLVTTPGDVDGDGDVDIFDIVTMVASYGSSQGDPAYDPVNDIDGDGDVDIFDIVIAAGNYGT